MKIAVLFAALAFAFAASGQSTQPVPQNNQARKRHVRPAPPPPSGFADGAVAFPVGRLRAQLARNIDEAKAKGSVTRVLENSGNYRAMLSVFGRSSGAEVDPHWDEVVLVEQGSATVITGGRVIDGQTGADGETRGVRIEGGQRQSLGAGDIFTVRAGTAHQFLLSPGTVFSAFIVQVREP